LTAKHPPRCPDPDRAASHPRRDCADRYWAAKQRDSNRRYSLQNAAGHADAKTRFPEILPITLIPGNDKQAGFWGFSPQTGDIQLNNTHPTELGIDDHSQRYRNRVGWNRQYGYGINTLTIVGGRIQNQIKNINTHDAKRSSLTGGFASNGCPAVVSLYNFFSGWPQLRQFDEFRCNASVAE